MLHKRVDPDHCGLSESRLCLHPWYFTDLDLHQCCTFCLRMHRWCAFLPLINVRRYFLCGFIACAGTCAYVHLSTYCCFKIQQHTRSYLHCIGIQIDLDFRNLHLSGSTPHVASFNVSSEVNQNVSCSV